VVGDPTDEILAAAGRLFGELGVNGTTMSRLAAEVGLKQSSLYYYFRSRDEVVAALVAQANVVPLALVDAVIETGGSAGARIFGFVRGDVEALCALPFDICEIHRVAGRDRERFADYWTERARLQRRLASIVRQGVDDGDLRPVDPSRTALTIMSNDEGVQNWYRLGTKRRPSEISQSLAELTVAGLLGEGRRLEQVVDEVSNLYRNGHPPFSVG
jgi:TetR/AcrR family transcriptional regulator